MVVSALPRASEVDGASDFFLFVFVFDLETSAEFLCEMAGEFFHHFRHNFEVSKGLIGFEHGEFGVVATRDSFVAEIPIEFEDFSIATYEKTLEEELGSDAESELHTKRVVMGLEGAGGSSSGDALEHRSFYFEVVAFSKEASNLGDHP